MAFSGHGFDRSVEGEHEGDRPKKATLLSGGGRAVRGGDEDEDPVARAIRNLLAPKCQCRKCGANLRQGNITGICSPCARSPARKRTVDPVRGRLEFLRRFLATPEKLLVKGEVVK